jgi:hypothetical protein
MIRLRRNRPFLPAVDVTSAAIWSRRSKSSAAGCAPVVVGARAVGEVEKGAVYQRWRKKMVVMTMRRTTPVPAAWRIRSVAGYFCQTCEYWHFLQSNKLLFDEIGRANV